MIHLEKFMKIVCHKHDLMIYLLVDSIHPKKYLYEIPLETFTEQPLLENMKLLRAVTFWNSYLFGRGNFLEYNYFQKSYFFKTGTSAQHHIFQKSHILEYVSFLEKQYSALPPFSGKLTFYSGYFFKRHYLLLKPHFQKSYFLIT